MTKNERITAYADMVASGKRIVFDTKPLDLAPEVVTTEEDREILDIRAEMKRDRESLRDCIDNSDLSVEYRSECLDRLAGMSYEPVSIPVSLRIA